MRNAFAAAMVDLAEADERVLLLSGDIGNRLFDPYKDRFGRRFYNCGVAEANMTGVAAGLALGGMRPVTYTIAPFNTARCYEQIRLDICYHNLPVIIVGVGAGLSYANLGPTHHALDDIALMRLLPEMTVVCPADAVEVPLLLKELMARGRPAYLRLGKKNEPIVHAHPPKLEIGRGLVLRTGRDLCLLSTGVLLPDVLAAADALSSQTLSVAVVHLHTVNPMETELLEKLFSRFRMVVTVEEHFRNGGLGTSVAEWLADHPRVAGRLFRLGLENCFLNYCGDQRSMRAANGLSAEKIAAVVADRWGLLQKGDG